MKPLCVSVRYSSPVNGGEFSLAGSARKHWLRCLVLLRKLGGSGSPGQLLQQQQTKIVRNWAVGALKTKGKPRRSRRCGCRRVMPRARQGVSSYLLHLVHKTLNYFPFLECIIYLFCLKPVVLFCITALHCIVVHCITSEPHLIHAISHYYIYNSG